VRARTGDRQKRTNDGQERTWEYRICLAVTIPERELTRLTLALFAGQGRMTLTKMPPSLRIEQHFGRGLSYPSPKLPSAREISG
jgi:hypothetical protein